MAATESQAISFRIHAEKINQLERLAKATDRSRSWHIEQALDSYLDVQTWQIAEIEKSITEMNAGQGIAHSEIRKQLLNWGKANNSKRAG